MIVETVPEKCDITARDLFNQPKFTTVFKRFVQRIETCVTESGVAYYPGILSLVVGTEIA